MTRGPRGLFVVLLPTLECNLQCDYCFEQHPRGRWDEATTDRVLDDIVELAERRRVDHLRLHWQGGEPLLLGEERLSAALEGARARAARAGIELEQSMQTNLTRYRSSLAPLVKELLGGRLGTSFEPGPARRFPAEQDGARFRKAWLEAFRTAEADGLEVGVLSLVGRDALDEGAASYLERLGELGIRRVRLTLPFEEPGSPPRGYWLDAGRVGGFLADAYRWWIEHGRDEGVRLKPMAWFEQMLTVGESAEPGLCMFAQSCVEIGLCITPSLDVTLCDSFATSARLALYGNLREEPLWRIYGGDAWRRAARRCTELWGAPCLECRYLPLCYGGCLVRAARPSPSAPERFHYCESYRALFEAIERHGPRRAT